MRCTKGISREGRGGVTRGGAEFFVGVYKCIACGLALSSGMRRIFSVSRDVWDELVWLINWSVICLMVGN